MTPQEMTPQEQYLRHLLASLLRPGEKVRHRALVLRKTPDGIEAGLYYAAWTNRRLLLVLTRRNSETGLPRRVNLGVEEYERADIERVVRRSEGDAGQLIFRLKSGTDVELHLDFSERSVSGQRAFFEAFDPARSQTVARGDVARGDVARGVASREAEAVPVIAMLADEGGSPEGGSLEAELARLEGLAPNAVVAPAPPVVPTASWPNRVPPVVASAGGSPVRDAEAYRLVKNQPAAPAVLAPREVPAKPAVVARRSNSGGVVALLLALAGSGLILVMFLGCAGLFLVKFSGGGRAASGRLAVPPSVNRTPTGGFQPPQPLRPPSYEPPTYQPPSFQPPSFQPPRTYESPPGGGLNGGVGRDFDEMHRGQMERMRQRQEEMTRQFERSRRRHEQIMERVRRPYP